MAKSNKIATTQDHLDIFDITDDLVVLKSGVVCAVLKTSAVNFELLSQREQDAAIISYAGLVNSLAHPMQVVIKSRRVDITDYLTKIEEAKENVESKILQSRLDSYKEFIRSTVETFEILEKSFYVAISYSPNSIQKTTSSNPFGFVAELFTGGKGEGSIKEARKSIDGATPQLNPRISALIREFKRMNIDAKRLNTEELIKFFYETYNPDSGVVQKMQGESSDYSAPMVNLLT